MPTSTSIPALAPRRRCQRRDAEAQPSGRVRASPPERRCAAGRACRATRPAWRGPRPGWSCSNRYKSGCRDAETFSAHFSGREFADRVDQLVAAECRRCRHGDAGQDIRDTVAAGQRAGEAVSRRRGIGRRRASIRRLRREPAHWATGRKGSTPLWRVAKAATRASSAFSTAVPVGGQRFDQFALGGGDSSMDSKNSMCA